MATESWPSGLPDAPLREGFSDKLPNTVIRTEMDKGIDKVRQRFRDGEHVQNMTFEIDKNDPDHGDQVQTFRDFFENKISHGAERFDFDDPIDGSTYEYRIVVPPEPVIENVGGTLYRVRLKMERLP